MPQPGKINRSAKYEMSRASEVAEAFYDDRENRVTTGVLVSTVNISVTKDGDWYTASDLNTNANARIDLPSLNGVTSASWILRLRKKPDATNGIVSFGFYQFSWSNHSIVKLEGPGTVLLSSPGVSGLPTVTGLSTTEDTVVLVVRDNISPGTSVSPLFYTGGQSAGSIGDGCLFSRPHIYVGTREREYIEPAVAATVPLPFPQSPTFGANGLPLQLTDTQVAGLHDGIHKFYSTERGFALYKKYTLPITSDDLIVINKTRRYYNLDPISQQLVDGNGYILVDDQGNVLTFVMV